MLFTIWPPRGQSVSSYSVQYRSSQTCKWPKIWITTKMQMCPGITLGAKAVPKGGIGIFSLWITSIMSSENYDFEIRIFNVHMKFFWSLVTKLREVKYVKLTTVYLKKILFAHNIFGVAVCSQLTYSNTL